MVDYSNAIAWMVISPLAVLTDIIAIIVIVHYHPFFHGTDVMMMSLMVAMAANALLVLPIPAFLELKKLQWNESLCSAYVWCFITFRVSQTLGLVAMSIHWSTVLKMSTEKRNCFSTKALKIATVFIWTISATIGLLPLIGAANDDYNESNVCKFLGFNLGIGFAIFFLIFNVAAMFVCVICTSDATFLIKHMKRVAEVKYQAGRFHLPDKRATVPSHGTSSINEKYNRLTFAWDLSKFVLVFSVASFLLNHFPFAIIQGAQVFAAPDRETLEVIVLWLVGLEALLLPHALWVISRRYRHALTYVWKVHVLRRKDVEDEDPYACMLQSYTRRERGRPRPPSVIGQNGGQSTSGTIRSTTSENRCKEYAHTNGQMSPDTRITAIANREEFESIPGSVRKQNGITRGEVHVENQTEAYNERAVDAFDFEIIDTPPQQHISNTPEISDNAPLRRISEASSSTGSQSSNRGAFLNRQDVKRSSSNNSRKEWKDQMKKKHLPPIFVNEAFDSEEQKAREKRRAEARETLYRSAPSDNLSNSSLHYYMSSDYHPDYLIDSLPRRTITETRDADYDGSVSSDKSSTKVKRKDSLGNEIPLTELRPYLSTFKVASMLDRNESFKSDISNASGMKDDSEIVFDVGALPLDEIDDGINSPKPMSTNLRIDSLDQWRHIQRTSSRASSFGSESSSKSSGSTPRNVHKGKRVFDRKMTDSPVYNISGIIEASTSFSRADQKESKRIASTNEADRDLQSTGSFKVSSLSSSQTSSDSIFRTNATDNFEHTSDAGDEMPLSSGSSCSVTLSPIKGENTRRPWMDEYIEDPVTLQMHSPLFNESDTDTLKDTHDDNEMKNFSYDSRNSELSTPVSSIFDEETDRGFEEALEMNTHIGSSVYAGVGLCFESILEEPEDLTSSGSNPFLDEISGDEFKTHAVVSKRSDSRTSSSTSASDNQLSYSADKSYQGDVDARFTTRTDTPVVIATDMEYEFGDSGFTSGIDNINLSDSSNKPEVHASGKLSPWPDSDDQGKDINMSFESDFSQFSNLDQHKHSSFTTSSKTISTFPDFHKIPTVTPTSGTGNFQRLPERHSLGNRKPSNKAVTEIRTKIKQAPSRVRSLDKASPEVIRKMPKRGRSVDDIEMDMQPAYF